MSDPLLAVWFSLLSAFMFGATFVVVRIGVHNASTMTSIWISLTVNVILLWGWSVVVYGLPALDWWQWRYFILAGLFAPLLGRTFQFMGMARLGANITTPITLTHPLVTMMIAVSILREPISGTVFLGAGLVLSGSTILGMQRQKPTSGQPVPLRPPKVWLLFPIAASLCYGISVVFRKLGIDEGMEAVTAAALTATASWLLISVFGIGSRRLLEIRCSKIEFGYLVAAGVFSSLGPVFLFTALRHGELIVVAPLAATTPLFVLVGTYWFIKDGELFTPGVISGTLATVIGVAVITVFG
ncbi:hypothetical protein LCGC14_0085960 [marine sediment metagenome]|uniref:EamA domain-containing protein n=1 Tax=marine sediment metagenome TaxID=412755 RepID=A0A0F9VW76_9ZZZZ|nr:DMT family transporter [Halomonas sp.]MCL5426404.1 DMT family transporter [Gammaproteobacteria bacterium]HDZ46301.1 DMT family transporter [Halomonas sp.]